MIIHNTCNVYSFIVRRISKKKKCIVEVVAGKQRCIHLYVDLHPNDRWSIPPGGTDKSWRCALQRAVSDQPRGSPYDFPDGDTIELVDYSEKISKTKVDTIQLNVAEEMQKQAQRENHPGAVVSGASVRQ